MHMPPTLTLALALATLGMTPACGDGGKTSDSDSSSGTASGSTGSTGGAGSSSPTSSTGEPTTGATTSGTTGTPTSTTSGDETTSSSSSGDSSSGGPACGGEGASCAAIGALCCMGLNCCAGVPVPEGQEFCSDNCPISDRRLKADCAELDAADVLRRLVALPLTSWRYRKDGPEVRHIGPMAQDFHAAFGLWNSDTMIFPLDASGVSMAAIQALHARLLAAEAENEDLRARLERLERRLDVR